MERVHEVTKDCFNALIQIRALGQAQHASPDMLYRGFCGFIENLRAKAHQSGLPERDVHDMMYAVIALADEVAMRTSNEVRDLWMQQPLQLHYFNENLAGENFFLRLDYILRDPARREALEVFHLCLLFGFQGKYAVRGGELELAAIHRRVQDALGHMRAEPLSPRAQRPRERIVRNSQGYLTIWIGLFAVLFALVLIIVLRYGLDIETTKVVNRIEALTEHPAEKG